MNIHKVVERKDFIELKRLLVNNPKLIHEVNEEGLSVTFQVAKSGDLPMLQYIVEYSMESMNTICSKGRRILHYSVMSGELPCVRYLVEKVGMSPVFGDFKQKTPFDIAYERGYDQMVEYFESLLDVKYRDLYRNPIRTGMFPDPSLVRVEYDYYMVNSSFIYFPCIPISHSKDLINWRIIGYAITNPEWAGLDELEGGRGYWAPDISYYKGEFYITATYRLNDTGKVYRKQMVVHSSKPEGPYSQPVFIDEDGIDPSIFNDDNGKRYMLLNRGARIFELSEDGKKKISKAELLYYGDNKRAPEGPHLLKKNGYYYLFLAEGGTGMGHRISVARSKELRGTYEPCPYNPIMRQTDPKATLQRCGHGKPVKTQNEQWYMIYLCGRSIGKGYTVLGRETAIDPIHWTADGWPVVNNLQGPSSLQKRPDLPIHEYRDHNYDDFDGGGLQLEWMFPRPPEKDGYKVRDSKLYLKSSNYPLSDRRSRNILLRRQKHFDFYAKTKMELIDMAPGQDSGMVSYYDENTWLKVGVFVGEDKIKRLKVVEHIGNITKVHEESIEIPLSAKHVWLKIICKGLSRTMLYTFNGKKYQRLLKLYDVNYLSDEGILMGKRFTGAMVGLYAFGNGSTVFVPYEYFQYVGQ